MEITNNTIQTVTSGQNVLFDSTIIGCSNRSIYHREGSGLVNVKGLGPQNRARYKVFFNGNIGVPASGTASAISLTVAIDGEPVSSSSMISTPTATTEYNNISSAIYIDVPHCCCSTISIQNTSTQSILVQNPNLIIERVA